MTDRFELLSPEFLENTRNSLRQVSWQLGNHAEAANEFVARAMAQIEAIGEARLQALRDAEVTLNEADDEYGDGYEHSYREDALDAVASYRRVAARIDAMGQRFTARTASLSDRGQHLVKTGATSLERRLEALGEYRAIQMPLADGGYTKAVYSQSEQTGTAALVSDKSDQVAKGPLPAGFGWVDLNEVDLSGFIDDPAEFKKANYNDMRRGLEIMRDEIIPSMERSGFGREDAERIDRELGTDYTAEGWIHPESRLTVWKAFLDPRRDADVVAVERGANGKYYVSSGRHRLGLARQLGIRMVPVRILGSNHGA